MDPWRGIQKKVWACAICHNNERVDCNERQQTPPPDRDVRLLLVGIAPPYRGGTTEKRIARSATNDADDNLRRFIVATLDSRWDDLLQRGLFLTHAAKCAMVPKNRHQNPPNDVLDACAREHFGEEINLLRPTHVVAFGKVPLRAVLRSPGVAIPADLKLSLTIRELAERSRSGREIHGPGWKSRLLVSPYPLRGKASRGAAFVLREAARLAGVTTTPR